MLASHKIELSEIHSSGNYSQQITLNNFRFYAHNLKKTFSNEYSRRRKALKRAKVMTVSTWAAYSQWSWYPPVGHDLYCDYLDFRL